MFSSPCLRGRISSPLEAGPSVADSLPGRVNEALEYASKRLGRKAVHITLLVVRRDYQLPTSPIASPTFPPTSPPPVSAASTLSRPAFSAASRLEALKQLVRSNNSADGQVRERIVHVHLDQFRNGTTSPAFSEASTASSASTVDSTFSYQRSRWPGSPATYGSVPVTPATPFTAVSSISGADAGKPTQASSQFGMKLVYAHPLSAREEKTLSQALEKAARKFKLDSTWLPQAASPSTLGLPADLVNKSSAQDESLFSSEHLTLISLDHLYTFRAALQAYARTKAPCRLEDAVDELRRLFLSNGRRPLRKSALLAAYRWLDPVSDAALADVCRMYERGYGGVEGEAGLENDIDPVSSWPLPEKELDGGKAGRSKSKRMGIAVPEGKGLRVQAGPDPGLEKWADPLEKEIMLAISDLSTDEQSELDEIEAWYRDVHPDPARPAGIDPLRSHSPSATTTFTTTTTNTSTTVTSKEEAVTRPPSLRSSLPPPPPTSPKPPFSILSRDWARPTEAELGELRRTTPKLRPAPPGRSLALKLQTTFDKPVAKRISSPVRRVDEKKDTLTHNLSQANLKEEGGDDEEEELTARPHSAIKSFATARWTSSSFAMGNGGNNGGGNGASIDEMLHGGGVGGGGGEGGGGGGGGGLQQEDAQEGEEQRVGPMTPNGYDDISPITRGEWGFLMFGKSGRTAKVEMC